MSNISTFDRNMIRALKANPGKTFVDSKTIYLLVEDEEADRLAKIENNGIKDFRQLTSEKLRNVVTDFLADRRT